MLYISIWINYMCACILHLTNRIHTYYWGTHGTSDVSSEFNESGLCSKDDEKICIYTHTQENKIVFFNYKWTKDTITVKLEPINHKSRRFQNLWESAKIFKVNCSLNLFSTRNNLHKSTFSRQGCTLSISCSSGHVVRSPTTIALKWRAANDLLWSMQWVEGILCSSSAGT